MERYLSSGNFGNTYIVQNTTFGDQLVMKEFYLRGYCYRTQDGHTVSITSSVKPESVELHREKFKKEAHRLRSLTSSHVVHVHDLFEENDTVYYVMDFVQGKSLADYMEQQHKPLTEPQVLFILGQLLDALDDVHSKSIWHLDLKPDNIMMDGNGRVTIIDFGASKQMGQRGSYSGTTSVLCYTPGFAALEQVSQDLDHVGPWTDIYALGATLYNLLTNQMPALQPVSAYTFPATISPQTRQLLGWMLQLERQNRPQSIAEIRKFMSGQANAAPVAPKAQPTPATPTPPKAQATPATPTPPRVQAAGGEDKFLKVLNGFGRFFTKFGKGFVRFFTKFGKGFVRFFVKFGKGVGRLFKK